MRNRPRLCLAQPTCLLLLTCACAAPVTFAPPDAIKPGNARILTADFDRASTGPYTEAELRRDWPDVRWVSGFESGRARLVAGDDAWAGNSLQLTFPAETYGTDTQAAHARIQLPERYEQLYLSYRVKFGAGFDFVLGGKLPGLAGGKANTGGHRPSGRDGWSARMMWRKNGRAVQYVYHPDQPDIYGEDFDWNVRFVPGRWHHVEHRIVMNTPGRRDGVIETWFDGEQALVVNDLRFRDTRRLGIDSLYLSTFFGGNDPAWASTRDETISFDDFEISTAPIGPHQQ